MPKVHHVKSARKDNEVVQKGQPYWWAQFKTGPTSSKTVKWPRPPRPSQLTLSPYLSSALALGEQLEDFSLSGDYETTEALIEDAKSVLEDIKSSVEELRDECQEKLDNMPEGLQQGGTGETLQGRVDGCDSAINNLDDAINELDTVDEEDVEAAKERAVEIVQGIDLSDMTSG